MPGPITLPSSIQSGNGVQPFPYQQVLGDTPADGYLGGITSTGRYASFFFTQVTSGITATLPAPSDPTPVQVYFVESSPASGQNLTMYGTEIGPGQRTMLLWDGTSYGGINGNPVAGPLLAFNVASSTADVTGATQYLPYGSTDASSLAGSIPPGLRMVNAGAVAGLAVLTAGTGNVADALESLAFGLYKSINNGASWALLAAQEVTIPSATAGGYASMTYGPAATYNAGDMLLAGFHPGAALMGTLRNTSVSAQ